MTKTMTFQRHQQRDAAAGHMGVAAILVNAIVAFMFAFHASAGQAKPLKIVAFGDSLTAGYGLDANDAFPSQLEAALEKRGHKVSVANAGVSGDTTAAGLARFDWAIPSDADAVIVELGANDALRGLDPKVARTNLDEILAKLSKRNLPVLIAGMAAPRNLGDQYVEKFDPIFADLAQKYDALLYPFFLDGVALNPDLNLPDGLHPTAKGVAVIVERILPKVEALIDRAEEKMLAEPQH
jgi:acyl-CoA thioesterase I